MPGPRPHRSCRAAARGLRIAPVLLFVGAHALLAQAREHEHDDVDEAHHHEGLHLTHPLFTESVSPDTKVRLDYSDARMPDGEGAAEMELEGEYAFARSFSVEMGLHLEPDAGEVGETHLTLKFANYAAEDAGVLLGYGVQLGIPTGPAHVHAGVHEPDEGGAEAGEEAVSEDIWEVTPFLNAGWVSGPWELVGWSRFSIPTNQRHQDDVGTELLVDTSLLRHFGSRAEGLVEALGRTGLSGPGSDAWILDLAPGVRVRPFPGRPLVVGAGVAVPLTGERDYDARLLVSAFWHF